MKQLMDYIVAALVLLLKTALLCSLSPMIVV